MDNPKENSTENVFQSDYYEEEIAHKYQNQLKELGIVSTIKKDLERQKLLKEFS